MTNLLEEFVTLEGDASLRRLLEWAIHDETMLQPHFEFNIFDVTIEREAGMVVLESVLDAADAGVQQFPLEVFVEALRHIPD
jgi:hypothetical protein